MLSELRRRVAKSSKSVKNDPLIVVLVVVNVGLYTQNVQNHHHHHYHHHRRHHFIRRKTLLTIKYASTMAEPDIQGIKALRCPCPSPACKI